METYSPIHKTLPKFSLQMYCIQVKFYEMGDIQNNLLENICTFLIYVFTQAGAQDKKLTKNEQKMYILYKLKMNHVAANWVLQSVSGTICVETYSALIVPATRNIVIKRVSP